MNNSLYCKLILNDRNDNNRAPFSPCTTTEYMQAYYNDDLVVVFHVKDAKYNIQHNIIHLQNKIMTNFQPVDI